MKTTTVDIDNSNLIAMLASPEFYGNDEVYIRELVQNGIDSCMTRLALEMSWGTEFLEMEQAETLNSMRKLFDPRITISYNSVTQRLSVEDNGIGMNAQDVERYVSKVGVSYYQSEEYQMQQLKYEPIGQFGIGMLSCFMVARGILIESKKDKSVNTAWNVGSRQSLEAITVKWFENSKTMEYVGSNRRESGAKITLVLKPAYATQLTLRRLVNLVKEYMLYQPFPVEVSFDDMKAVVSEPNRIMENPFADILGVVAIRVDDDFMEGYIWIFSARHEGMEIPSRLYQQGFLAADESQELDIRPPWIKDMSYRLNIKKRFLTLRASRDGVAKDGKLHELRGLIGRKIVEAFSNNTAGLGQYLSNGHRSMLTGYEDEMKLLGHSVTVDVYLKGRAVELPVDTIIDGFMGKVIRIAFITRGLFDYYRANYVADFKKFLKDNRLIVFEKNRDIFSQFLAPYTKSRRYVISEHPGIIYDDMVADFSEEKNVMLYRNAYSLLPKKFGYDDIFCMVTNTQSGHLDITVNEEHRLYKLMQPVMDNYKVHNFLSVVLENIRQRIINSSLTWNKLVDFGGAVVHAWDPNDIATVQSIWCLEASFIDSLNEFVDMKFTDKEMAELELVGLEFRRDDFINWWFTPHE
ncbi:MAG: ATP-binding protein [Clostridiales bacterium]|nr:ATP-binding protein [Clostridiales bacterium]